jgi:hypothetical protein
MTTGIPTIYADLNYAYPSRGQRRYTLYRREATGEVIKLDSYQFNSLKPAERKAYALLVASERARNRTVYLGD